MKEQCLALLREQVGRIADGLLAQFPAACLLISMVGCGVDDAVDESKEWRAELAKTREALLVEIQKTREAAVKTADAAISAIPGERYLRLVDDLHGDDVAARDSARIFLTRLIRGRTNAEPVWPRTDGAADAERGHGRIPPFRLIANDK